MPMPDLDLDAPKLDPLYLEQSAHIKHRHTVGVVHFAGHPITMVASNGKAYQFEWHSYCGPTVLTSQGEPRTNQLPERDPFWAALTLWINQGMRVDENHHAVWSKP
jgi:hypothetical protein